MKWAPHQQKQATTRQSDLVLAHSHKPCYARFSSHQGIVDMWAKSRYWYRLTGKLLRQSLELLSAKQINLYLRRGGRKPAPKAMLMVFFVSALKYLEVKAVATVVVSIPRYFRPDQLQLGRFRPNPGQEPFGARSRAETCWKQFSAIWRPFGRLLHFAFGKNGKRLHIQF